MIEKLLEILNKSLYRSFEFPDGDLKHVYNLKSIRGYHVFDLGNDNIINFIKQNILFNNKIHSVIGPFNFDFLLDAPAQYIRVKLSDDDYVYFKEIKNLIVDKGYTPETQYFPNDIFLNIVYISSRYVNKLQVYNLDPKGFLIFFTSTGTHINV